MKITAEPRSDQLNAEDFLGGPRTYTVTGVRVGTAEQKYDIALEGEQRVWRPPLTVLRTLIKCWGDDAADWQGRRVTLYCDESVTFGNEAVGGIRVSHVSHIDKTVTVSVTATRGKKRKVTVKPLTDTPPAQPSTIAQDAWEELNRLATDAGIENVPAWISEQLGRPLQGWQEITMAEADRLRALLTDGEVQS